MAQRRGPETGYDFGSKRQYRRDVYAAYKRYWRGHLADKVIAMLPSIEGAEIDVALSAGIRESNICIIDSNPAIVATLKRKYPRVTAYGVDAATAAERIKKDFGTIHAVNLDLCGPIGRPLWDTLGAWVRSGVLRDSALVAVTLLRGREQAQWKRSYRLNILHAASLSDERVGTPRDLVRLTKVNAALTGLSPDLVGQMVAAKDIVGAPYAVAAIKRGIYKSTAGNQTMLWGIWRLHKNPCPCDECVGHLAGFGGLPTTSLNDALRAQICWEWLARTVWGNAVVDAALRDAGDHTAAERRRVVDAIVRQDDLPAWLQIVRGPTVEAR